MSAAPGAREYELATRFMALPKERRAQLFSKLQAQGIDLSLLPIPVTPPGPERERLSFAQERLWFLAQLDPDSVAYNMSGSLRMRGQLDRAALAMALRGVVQRHESLRTCFETQAGVGRARLHELPIDVRFCDARAEFAARGEACVPEWADREAARAFDLERGPLVRASLVQFGAEDYGLFLGMHHIVSDGWSLRVFIDELAHHYGAAVSGAPLELAPLTIQYADYASWQRSWLEAGELQRQLAYFREQLAGSEAVLPLPTDRPRPAEQSHRGALCELSLPAELVAGMQKLARSQGVTLFMLGLAAWKALLHRATGRTDLCVGSSIANRGRLSTEGLIGFFVNTQVLRSRPRPDLPFSQYLAAVKQVALAAQSHQDLPFEQLVDALSPERSLGHNPLFQVHYDHQQRAYAALRALPGLSLEPIAREQRSTLFDLSLTTIEQPDGSISGHLEYATDLFDPATIEALSVRFVRLLRQVVERPNAALAEIELGTADECTVRPADAVHWAGDAATQAWLASQSEAPLRAAVLDAQARTVPPGLVGALHLASKDALEATGLLARFRRDGAIELVPVATGGSDERPLEMPVREYCAPQSELEEQLCAVWQEVLQLQRVSATDNFFELGGDSIVSIQVVSRARERGIALRPKDLFQHQTVRKLASVARLASARAELAATLPAADVPLTPIQAAFFARELPEPHHYNQSLLLECREPLDARALERALACVLEQHASLRTGFRRVDGRWVQRVLADDEMRGRRVLNVAHVSDRDEVEAHCDAAQASLDLSRGELIRALLLRLPDGTSLLLLAVHHLAIDGVSWRVLLEDLQRAYVDSRQGRAPELPPRTSAFAAWAEQLAAHAASDALAEERGYWQDVARELPELPRDGAPDRPVRSGDLQRIPLRLDRAETARLLKHSASAYRTQIQELLLAALSRALCETFAQRSVAVLLEGHGREDLFDDMDVSRTLGWFTTEYPVVLTPEPDVASTIVAVKEQLRAVPAHGIGHGLLRWLGPESLRAQLQAAVPRVAFNYLGQFDASFGEDALFRVASDHAGAELAPSTKVDHWLEINGQVFAGELTLWIGFSPELYRPETVARLAERFERDLREIIAHCTTPGAGALTPSDFPLARLDRAELDLLEHADDSIEDVYPVTPMQHGMLFHALYDPEPGVYVTQLAVTIEGLSPERFCVAWQHALERHAILRTSFAWEGLRQPVQRVSASAPLRIERIDLRGVADSANELERIVREQHRRGFDLQRAPLWRLALVQLDERRHHFIWTHHHLLLDGWSTARLLDEVLVEYLGRARPEASPPFSDYVAWLARRDHGASEAFWRERLREVSEPTLLAGHLMGPLARDYRVEREGTRVQIVRTRLTAEHTLALTRLAQREHVTLNSLVQAAWSLLLARYTGQAQVVFGATTSGRPPELRGSEQMLGLFINTLPVVVAPQPRAALRELWQGLQRDSLDAREHEHAPLAQIQRWSGHGSGDLFDTLIVFENFPIDQALAADWQSLSFGSVQTLEITNYALTLAVRPSATLELDYGFDPARVPASAVERIGAQLVGLLRDFVESSPLVCAGEIGLAGDKAQQAAGALGDAEKDALGPVHDAILDRLLARSPERAHEAVVVGARERWTAAELVRRSARIAVQLRALGVGAEARVGLYVERGPWLIAGALAVWQTGAAYVPLDPSYPRERLEWMIGDSSLTFVLGQPCYPALAGARVLDIAELSAAEPKTAPAEPPATVHPSQLAYVIYTSGSTGTPKGVGVSHGALAMHARAVADIYGYDERDCALHMASASFDAAVEQWVVPLVSGARLVLSDEQPWTPSEMLEVLHRDQVSVIYPPTAPIVALAEWLEQRGESYTLRACCVGGEAVSRESAALIRRVLRPKLLINGYGPTETVVTPTLWRATPDMVCDSAYAPIGWVVGDRSAYVLDAELNVQPRGVAGELYLGGSGMARGYIGRPGLTAERFVPDPFSSRPGGRLYRTGDRVRALPDGTLEYLERVDHQVKLRGHRIELGEIEARLLAHREVSEAVVVVRRDLAAARLVGYVGASDEAARERLPGELLAQLAAALPAYLVPAQLVALAQLPRTPNGKIDRAALPAPAQPRREPRPARTELERELLGHFEQVLGAEDLGIDDDFFERGGDSLSSLQLVSRARVAGRELSLKDVFALRSVAALAGELESRVTTARPPERPIARAPVTEGVFALSYSQERLWFLAQLEPDSPAYNISGAVRLRGPLEPGLVQRAFDALARRHAALRTGFEGRDGAGVQRVHADASVPVRLLDARGEDAEASARALFVAQTAEPFSLAAAPLVRVSLIQLGADHHVLVVTLHHLIADGWSMRVLVDEFAQLYAAYVRDETPALDEPALQYLDYAAWQRAWLEAGEADRQLAYWQERLGDTHPVLSLPTDRPRPALRSPRGDSTQFSLDAATSQAVAALARAQGASVFMLLLAAFQSVLYRLTGQHDLRIGVPVSNRNRAETERVVGLFVNTQVLRTELHGELTFQALLARVRETALGAQSHQDLPFERLVDALSPERSLSHNPLFQVMYDHQRAGTDALRTLPNLTATAFEVDARTTQFDLSLTTLEDAGCIHGSFTYAVDLYDRASIERLSERLVRVLHAILREPGLRIAELPLLSEPERSALAALSGPREPRPWSGQGFVHAAIGARAEIAPDATAVEGEDAAYALTYAELEHLSNRWAQRLRRLGVGPESRVGLCVGRSPRMVLGALAIWKAGGAYVALDPSYPVARLRSVVADAGVQLLVSERAQPLASELGVARCAWLDADDIGAEPAIAPTVPLRGEHLAYVVYTSGSTGRPKGVGVSHAALAAHVAAIGSDYGLCSDDCALHFASMGFDAGVEQWAAPLVFGARLLVRGDELWSAQRALSLLRERGVTWFELPPSYLRELADHALERGESIRLRACSAGAEALSRESLAIISRAISPAPVINGYGPTEAVITPMTWHATAGAVSPTAYAPIGRVVGDRHGYVLDAELNLVPVGVTGELYLGGSCLARGYVGQSGLTAERFVPDPYAAEPGRRMYRTGDLARLGANGDVEFLGRADHQVKVRGFRIELGEVEAQLLALPGVREAVVVARGDAGSTRLIGYVAGDADADTLRSRLLAALPEYMVPSQLLVLGEFPRNENGKLDRKRLPEPSAPVAEYVAPASEVEARLCAIWQDVLRIERVGATDNFFALGGDSIRSLQVISRADKLGLKISPRDLFEHQTPAELARVAVLGSSEQLSPVPRDTELHPLSFAQERLWFLAQLDPHSAAYNIAGAVRAQGVDCPALQSALDALIARHEALRTTFEAIDGEPRQRVHAAGALRVQLQLHELDAYEPELAEQRARSLVEAQAHEPFELERGPLLRVSVARLSGDECVLALAMHHIISDGWSIDLLIAELAALHAGQALPPLRIQYVDYAAWQRRSLTSDERARQLAYWRAQLGDEQPVLELPADRPPPATPSFQGAVLEREIEPELARSLYALARARGVTLHMLLLAAWQTLLYRLSGQPDVRVGVPITNRNRLETEGVIGMFVNTLVLRSELNGELPFSELLQRVKRASLEAGAHAELPFEQLVEALSPERSLSHNPLFQVTFNHASLAAPEAAPAADRLALREFRWQARGTQFDLSLDTEELADQRLKASFTYAVERFDAQTIDTLGERFEQVLKQVAAREQIRVAELELLTGSELSALERERRAQAERPRAIAPPVHEQFAVLVRSQPEALALACGSERWSFGQLGAAVARWAERLRHHGVGPEKRVGVCLERTPRAVLAPLAIWTAGGVYVPLDPELPAERVRALARDAGLALVLTERALGLSGAVDGLTCLELDHEDVGSERADAAIVPSSGAALAYVLYTSGSTGVPKGVAVTHDALAMHVAAIGADYGLDASDCALQFASTSFDTGLEQWLAPLLHGARVVMRGETLWSAEQCLAELAASGVTRLDLPPGYLQQLAAAVTEQPQPLALRSVISGGEALPAESLPLLRAAFEPAELINAYGPTEAVITPLSWHARDCVEPSAPFAPIGRAVGERACHVLDRDLRPLPNGVVGELYLGGMGLARGYLDRPAQTAERFLPDPFSATPGARMYATGDRVKRRRDGVIEYVGRTDHQVKIRGFRVELGEVEARLRALPGVRDAAVIGSPDPARGLRLLGYVVGTDDVAELERQLRESLPDYMLPSQLMALDALPRTAAGKLDRARLPVPERPAGHHVAPRSPMEARLRAIWQDVLGVERVSITDNFFELGGHSLLVMKVVSRVRAELGLSLAVRQLFETRDLAELAALLSGPTDGQSGLEGAVASALTELEELSEDELARLLAEDA